MISRLTAVATAFAVITAVSLAFTGSPRSVTTVATAGPAATKQIRFIELEPVVVTGKRLQRSDPI